MVRKLIAIVLTVIISVLIGFCMMSDRPLEDEKLDNIISNAQQKFDIPAIAICVFDATNISNTAHAGVRIYGTDTEIAESDYYHIGSCSKAVLAYIASRLVEEGAIEWNTSFFEIYPDLKAERLPVYSTITLEDLLSCRAGIKPYTSGMETYPDLENTSNATLGFIKYLLSLPPASSQTASGQFEFLYSNASYTLASAMLESVSGLPWEDLVGKYINQGLGLNTVVGWPYELNPSQPWGHLIIAPKSPPLIVGPDSTYNLNPLINPSGNISMTSNDFSKFVQLHLACMSGGNEMLNNPDIRQTDFKYETFSDGIWNGIRLGKEYICLDGTGGTYYARGVIFPESDFGFTIMMNAGSEEAVEFISMKLFKEHYHLWWMFWI